MRVKPHTQIAIELFTVRLVSERRDTNISADSAIWEFIKRHDPALAKEAINKAKDEGFKIPKELEK